MVKSRFQKAFGEPDHVMGKDWHWSLPPYQGAPPINVLFDGGVQQPAVWVFDPHTLSDGVYNCIVTEPQQVDDVIHHIQDRVSRAARAHGVSR